jgi:hypothetical protein
MLGDMKDDKRYVQLVADSLELRQLIDQFKLEPDDKNRENIVEEA